jgi:hypothetical protein
MDWEISESFQPAHEKNLKFKWVILEQNQATSMQTDLEKTVALGRRLRNILIFHTYVMGES